MVVTDEIYYSPYMILKITEILSGESCIYNLFMLENFYGYSGILRIILQINYIFNCIIFDSHSYLSIARTPVLEKESKKLLISVVKICSRFNS